MSKKMKRVMKPATKPVKDFQKIHDNIVNAKTEQERAMWERVLLKLESK